MWFRFGKLLKILLTAETETVYFSELSLSEETYYNLTDLRKEIEKNEG